MPKPTNKQLNEFQADDMQSQIPDPVVAGDPHAGRAADNTAGDVATQGIDPRLAQLSGLLNVLRGADTAQLTALAQFYLNGGASQAVGGGTQATTPLMATLTPGGTTGLPQEPMYKVSEGFLGATELKTLLEDTGLDETFQEKAALIFTVALQERTLIKEAEIQASFEKRLEEQTVTLKEELDATVAELVKGIDAYASMVCNTWLEENKLAIDSGIKAKLGENVIKGLRNLVEAHSIRFTEDDVPVVEKLEAKLAEGEVKYNDLANSIVGLQETIDGLTKEKIINETSAGLTLTEKEKLVQLCENVEFEDAETFTRKLSTLKETYIKTGATAPVPGGKSQHERLDEEVTTPAPKPAAGASGMARYVKAAKVMTPKSAF